MWVRREGGEGMVFEGVVGRIPGVTAEEGDF